MSEDLHRRGIGMTSQRTRERLIQRLYEEGLSNARVLEVIRRTPRHLFVDEALSHRAYEDTALPIGHNQTISQPFMVARMTELLHHRHRGGRGSPAVVAGPVGPGGPSGDPGRWRRGPATDADRPHRGRVQPPGTRLGTFRPAAQRPDRLSRRPASPARLNESEEDG